MKLLIVEDDTEVARMLKRVLSKKYDSICIAYTADDGVKEINNPDSNYDVVITDWDCPGDGDGIRVVTACGLKQIPVLVHTGNAMVRSKDFEIIYKPADMNVIIDALAELVQKDK